MSGSGPSKTDRLVRSNTTGSPRGEVSTGLLSRSREETRCEDSDQEQLVFIFGVSSSTKAKHLLRGTHCQYPLIFDRAHRKERVSLSESVLLVACVCSSLYLGRGRSVDCRDCDETPGTLCGDEC